MLRTRDGSVQQVCDGPRENTLASFRQAIAEHAVDFVEFDVQVTLDGVPVIWHDDYVVHGSMCTPKRSLVAQLTCAELQALPQLLRWFKDADLHLPMPCDYLWRCQREDSIPTLQQLFDDLPEKLAFNIEIKMATSPALDRTPMEEVHRVVDPIVECLAQASTARRVAISSFDPDVMAYCSHCHDSLCKGSDGTRDTTLWFLTEAGKAVLVADVRKKSISAAIQVAQQAKLSGLVIESAAAHAEAGTVAQALQQELLVMTYGLANNDPEWVAQQRDQGFAGVIVDDLAAITGAV